MAGAIQIAQKDLRQNLIWYFWWAILVGIYSVMLVFTYPGKKGLESLLSILQDPIVSVVFGIEEGLEPNYGFWINMVMPFFVIVLLACSMLGGSRLLLKEIDDKTGELLFSLPLRRTMYLLTQLLVNLFYQLILWIVVLFPLAFPVQGENISLEVLIMLFVLGMGVSFFGSAVGLLIGVVKGDGGGAQQIGLLVLLLLYVSQILARLKDSLGWLSDTNPLNWANSTKIILKNQFPINDFSKYIVLGLIFLVSAIIGYSRKDLTENIDLISIRSLPGNIFKKSRTKSQKASSKSYASSLLVKWAGPLKSKCPFLADFVFSEARVLLIVSIALLAIFPLQILFYTDELVTEEFRASWGSNPMIRVFSWGHVDIQDPYLWIMSYQTFGALWFVLLPLALIWPKKILFSDQNHQAGEIISSLPVAPKAILLQRQLATLLELVFIWLTSSILLILSEIIIGQTKFTFWEAYSMLVAIPFYYFMTSSITVAGIICKEKGSRTAQTFYVFTILWFVVQLSANSEVKWYHKGYFGLYDPLAIVLDKAILGSNYELVLFTLLSIVSTFLLYRLGNRYSLVNR